MSVIADFWEGNASPLMSTRCIGSEVAGVELHLEVPKIASCIPVESVSVPNVSSMKSTVGEFPTGARYPGEVRMITYSDAIPRVNLPAIPAPELPDLSISPLALLVAANGGELDFQALETLDNATLEALVPRDPCSGRPLTIGSLQHGESKCRPCIFYLRAKCFKGLRCSFCHFNHQSVKKPESSDDAIDSLELNLQSVLYGDSSATSSATGPTVKTKRVRPSKRTREMIKQINEQMLFGDIHEDPLGPALSISTSNNTPSML